MNLEFPLQIGDDGQLVEAGRDRHLRDLMEQVLFTRLGERVNRPDFGCGIQDLIFEPVDDAMVARVAQTTTTQLRKWLSDVIVVDDVEVIAPDSESDGVLQVVIRYRPVGGESAVATLSHPL